MKNRKWSDEDVENLKASPLTASFQLAYRYNRSERAVRSKRSKLGLAEPYLAHAKTHSMKTLLMLFLSTMLGSAIEPPVGVVIYTNNGHSITMSFTNFPITNWAGMGMTNVLPLFRTNTPASVEAHIQFMKQDQSLPGVINKLAASGEICKTRGHAWGQHAHVTLEHINNRVGCRLCVTCGLHQNQFSEWK